MTRAERYRQKARELRGRIASVRDSELRREFLQLAEQYDAMALDADEHGQAAGGLGQSLEGS